MSVSRSSGGSPFRSPGWNGARFGACGTALPPFVGRGAERLGVRGAGAVGIVLAQWVGCGSVPRPLLRGAAQIRRHASVQSQLSQSSLSELVAEKAELTQELIVIVSLLASLWEDRAEKANEWPK